MKTKISSVAAMIAALILSACGGGGGGSASTTPTAPVQSPTSDVQSSVPAPTYAAGSQELAFFNMFNDFRAKLGLGQLRQNAKLDQADQNHLAYLLAHPEINFSAIDAKTGRPQFHIEDAALSKFTGVTELDRATFTGYGGVYVGETGGYGGTVAGSAAVTAFNNLVNTVYHRQGLMFQAPRDIGIAFGNDFYQTMVMTFGYQSTPQKNASNFFGAYPADKQTGVPLVAGIETPNPFPDLATIADYNAKTSFPINVVSEASTTLTVNSFTVTEAGQSVPLSARLVTAANDTNKQLAANTAFLVGNAPFKANTTYVVNFTGTINGANTSKTWSFTTGS